MAGLRYWLSVASVGLSGLDASGDSIHRCHAVSPWPGTTGGAAYRSTLGMAGLKLGLWGAVAAVWVFCTGLLWTTHPERAEESWAFRAADHVAQLEDDIALLRAIRAEQRELDRERSLSVGPAPEPTVIPPRHSPRLEPAAAAPLPPPPLPPPLPTQLEPTTQEEAPPPATPVPRLPPAPPEPGAAPSHSWECPFSIDADDCPRSAVCRNCFCQGLVHDTKADTQEKCAHRCDEDPYCSSWQWGSKHQCAPGDLQSPISSLFVMKGTRRTQATIGLSAHYGMEGKGANTAIPAERDTAF